MSSGNEEWTDTRASIMGLGDASSRKTYFSELQKRIEELNSQAADIRTLFNSTHDAIIIHDLQGRVFDVNESMLQLYGLTREEALNLSVGELSATPDQERKMPEIIEDLRSKRRDLVFEWTARRPKDGQDFPCEVALRCITWKNRDMVVAVVRDIRERKRLEEERRALEEQLAQARRLETIGRLAGGIAHDFNNLLTPILSYACMLQEGMPAHDPRRGDLEEVIGAAKRARELTQQLLAYARRQTLRLRPFDLNHVVQGMQRLLGQSLKPEVRVEYQLAPGLPQTEGDARQIEQVLLNLVLNAQDAMPSGGKVEVSTFFRNLERDEAEAPAGNYVCLCVRDTGIGMDPLLQTKIFEPFFTTKGLGRGTGLGLASVYGIVRQHEGFITVESSPGKGACFTILLPHRSETAKPLPGVEAVPQSEDGLRGEGHILLVEDQAQVRQSTRRVLEGCGYVVSDVEDGFAALRFAKENTRKVDLLITDVMLHGLNGREVYEHLKSLSPGLRVLYFSGYPEALISKKGILLPDDPLLAKPFTPEELVRKVREVLTQL